MKQMVITVKYKGRSDVKLDCVYLKVSIYFLMLWLISVSILGIPLIYDTIYLFIDLTF